jgi:hypothetical protein
MYMIKLERLGKRQNEGLRKTKTSVRIVGIRDEI